MLTLTVWPAFAPIWNWRSWPETAVSAVALNVPIVPPRVELVESDRPLSAPVEKPKVLPSALIVSLVCPLIVSVPLAPVVVTAVETNAPPPAFVRPE